jgi:uncharacterized protein HemY
MSAQVIDARARFTIARAAAIAKRDMSMTLGQSWQAAERELEAALVTNYSAEEMARIAAVAKRLRPETEASEWSADELQAAIIGAEHVFTDMDGRVIEP